MYEIRGLSRSQWLRQHPVPLKTCPCQPYHGGLSRPDVMTRSEVDAACTGHLAALLVPAAVAGSGAVTARVMAVLLEPSALSPALALPLSLPFDWALAEHCTVICHLSLLSPLSHRYSCWHQHMPFTINIHFTTICSCTLYMQRFKSDVHLTHFINSWTFHTFRSSLFRRRSLCILMT